MATIIPLDAVDPALIEQLLDAAFGEDRRARTAYRIRENCHWLEGLSFAVLDDEDFLAGTIQLWPVALATPDGRGHPLIMVGPVAVLPDLQNEGYGKALMGAALGAVEAMAGDGNAPLPQVMIGDPDYYGRWGFNADHTGNWHCPGPFEQDRLLLRCENPGILPDEGMLGPWAG
ncbi:GNAT family N-acetyltransferase [Parerythrobacter jejuensis]|uniref:GNAT family N-acetyltransferase n=1 Tax=Parerythrobacter jejuensis TaxID=795812 RepID=A0A845AS19_9SPHN|nr:N-acetyltransferase [Parerythrobacter jejuensis]MXP31735.1 GNAT family N-acetyltransferase [Parerythrobacter jejuensis]